MNDRWPGRLVAVDGTRATDIAAAADTLVRKLRTPYRPTGVSRGDACGAFQDVAAGKPRVVQRLSPRSLLLLYAADLAFRMRWEIRPALESGTTVIAAPYVLTAVAWGEAAGLPSPWLRELFRLSPEADASYRVEERKPRAGWKAAVGKGFAEFAMAAGALPEDDGLRIRMIERLDCYEQRGRCAELTPRALRAERNLTAGLRTRSGRPSL